MANNSSPNIVKTIKKILPATVTIVVLKDFREIQKESLKEFKHILPKQKKRLKELQESADKNGMVKISSGSGFITDPGGIIISNRHVISDPSAKYNVVTNAGDKYEAKIIARDPVSDLAILKIEPGKLKLPFIKLGDSSKLELGETVLAIGNALGIFQNTVSSGIISGLSRSITAQIDSGSPIQEIHGLIQTDTAINPGNSGGPLVDINGEAIGVNIAIILGAENISFALPINTVKRDLNDLKKYGRIKRPFLGVHYLMIDDEVKDRFGLAVDYGAYVISEKPYSAGVIENSPAAKAGIRDKDIILECGGCKVSPQKTIGDILETCLVGDRMRAKILRNGKEFEVKIVLAERI